MTEQGDLLGRSGRAPVGSADESKCAAAHADALAGHADYRVLRRLRLPDRFNPEDGGGRAYFVSLDTETTGLDPTKDEIINLALTKVEFSPASGKVLRVVERFNAFQQPKKPISAEISELTGITNDDVAGQKIDLAALARFMEGVVLIVAHHAEFDRPFCERLDPFFEQFYWACSIADVPWEKYGIKTAKLDYLGFRFGFFFDGHRALNDCEAVVAVLADKMPGTEQSVFPLLLDSARRRYCRIRVFDAPFVHKDTLKVERGYSWFNGRDGLAKHWWKDLPDGSQSSAEVEWLWKNIEGSSVRFDVAVIDGRVRFSRRI